MEDEAPRRPGTTENDRPGWIRFWPIAVLLATLALAWAFDLQRHVSVGALAEYRGGLTRLAAARPAAAALLYLTTYTAIVALSVPVGPVLTMAGGLLFGIWRGAALAVPAATAGACILFLAVRSALAPALARRAGPRMKRLLPGLERDGFWYLLSLRLLPVVPYPVGSIAPALVGMRLSAFAAATALGILPGTVVFAGIGAGLGEVVARGGRPDPSALLSPPVLLPLAGLAALSLLTVWWRRRRHGS